MYSPVTVAASLLVTTASVHAGGPFLRSIDESTHIIGNDLWNITIGRTFGTKLYYKDQDLIGNAWGHYVSYSRESSLTGKALTV